MLNLDFDNFRVKNKNQTKSFEDMCRILFLREHKKYDYNYSYDKNQAGLEIDPICNKSDNKYYGLQVKFFETEDNSAKYKQIEKSLDKAYKYYKNLDYIYIYTNAELRHTVTDEELNGEKDTPRIRIERKSKENGIKLKWIQKETVLDKVRNRGNLDLYNLYFSESRELEFLESGISVQDKTFLMADEYLKLNLSEDIDIYKSLGDGTNVLTLVLGSAGTGKSMLMKKIHLELSNNYIEYYFNKENTCNEVYMPIFIRLKEATNWGLEEIIRFRTRDYGLNHTHKKFKYIYLLDGLDEISEKDLYNVINTLERLSKMNKGQIIISSRIGSNNLILLRQKFKTKNYNIKSLNLKDIEKYFEIKNDMEKIQRLNEIRDTDIIKSIDDIFSVKLLWENVKNIDKFTTKINMIEISVDHWIDNYSKLSEIPLLEPKKDRIFDICTEVAFRMQKNLSISITLKELQSIIIRKFKVNNVNDVNIIISSLMDLFLEYSSYSSEEENLSFRHRRYQEYFLYQRIYTIFFNNPSILRELNLLSNKDFIITIFLKTSLVKAKKDKDLFKYLALSLFESYLGNSYIEEEYRDGLIGSDYLFGTSEPSYIYSERFIYLLSTYLKNDLFELLDNTNLSIGNALTKDNYWKLIELYHRSNNVDISKQISEKYNFKIDQISDKDFDSFFYFLYKIQNKSIDEIKNMIADKQPKLLEISYEDIKSKYSIESLKLVNSLINLLLEFEIEYLENELDDADNKLLEVISYRCLKFKNIDILLGSKNEGFRKCFTERIEKKEENYYIHTIVLYNFINYKQIEIEKMEEEFKKYNIYHYWTWDNNIDFNIFLSYVLNKNRFELTEFEQGVNILRIFMDRENSQEDILNKWIGEIKQYNFIYKNGLIYSNSRIIGELISNWNFEPLLIKRFLREISEYGSVIYFETILFIMFKNNNKLFNKVINKSILDYGVKNTLSTKDYYESTSESFYSFAAMYSKYDLNKKYQLLMKGLNNDILRPAFKGEDIFDRILTEAIDIAYENYWIDKIELEEAISLIYKNIVELSEVTDNSKNLAYLKFVVEKHIPSSPILRLNDFYRVSSSDYKQATTKHYKFIINDIDIDNLEKYYKCNIEAPHYSLEFWESLIEIELEENKSLDILFNVFKEYRYPSMEGYPIFDYVHIPTSILLSNNITKNKMLEFIFDNPGRNGIFNMLRVYSLLGEVDLGMTYLTFLIEFSKALLDVEDSNIKYNTEIGYADIIRSSSKDWVIRESENYAFLKRNEGIVIKWDDFKGKRKFYEDWATNHIDKSAYMYEYKLYKDNSLIKEFNLVYVDGYRALLPVPKLGTNIVKRDEYFLSRIFNSSIDELNNYMILSGLIVE